MKKSNLKRVLALVLTVLMVVGLVPLSVFAVSAETVPNAESEAENALGAIITAKYKTNPKYWKTVWSTDVVNLASKAGATGRTDVTYDGTYMELDPTSAGTIPVNSDGTISLPHDAAKDAGNYGSAPTGGTAWISYKATRTNVATHLTSVWKNNLAGVDVAVNANFKLSSSSTAGKSGVHASTENGNASGNSAVNTLFKFVCTEDGGTKTFTLELDSKTVATLPADEYFNIRVLFDYGGEDYTTAGRQYYVFLNNEFVGARDIATEATLKKLHELQDSSEAEHGVHPHGLSFMAFYFCGGAVCYDIDNIGVYQYDENADGLVTDATRGAIANFVYRNDFNSGTYDSAGTGGFNVTAPSIYANMAEIRNGAGDSKIADGVLAYSSSYDDHNKKGDTSDDRYKGNFCVYTQSSGNNKPNTAMSGKDVVYQADYKLGTAMPNGTLASLNCTLVAGTTVSSNPVYVNASGDLLLNTDGDADGDTKIGKLSKDKFTTVAFAVDVTNNKVKVYIDGELAGETILLTEAQKTTVAGYDSTYTNGFGVTTVGCYRESTNTNAVHSGVIFYIDDIVFYYGSYIDTKLEIALADVYRSATAAEISGTEGVTLDRYYDFTEKGSGWNRFSAACSVSDGVLTLNATSSTEISCNFLLNGCSDNTPKPANQGKNFVYSCDFKRGDNISAGQLMTFNSFRKNTSNSNAPFTAIPLWINSKGEIYAVDDTKLSLTNPDDSSKTYTGGCVFHQNAYAAASFPDALVDKELGAIATLSKDEFVNIAVQVLNNKWMVYVNGEQAFSEWRVFMSAEAAAVYFNDNGTGYEETTAEGDTEFAVTNVAYGWRKNNCTIIADNTAFYWGNTFVKGSGKQIYNDDYQIGYKLEEGAIYNYSYGELVTNAVSPDGLLTTDENGKVLFNGTPIASMDEVYTTDANGDIIMANGVYPGYYRANALLGKTDGTLYYYNGGNLQLDTAAGNRFDLFKKTYYMDGVLCTTLSDILDNVPDGYSVKVCENLDFTGESVQFFTNVTLELQNFTITADSFLAEGDVTISSTEKDGVKGAIKVPKGKLYYNNAVTESASNNMYIYMGEEVGYVKQTINAQHSDVNTTITNNKFTVEFRPTLGDKALNEEVFKGGANARDLEIRVKMVIHTAEGDVTKYAVFTDDIIQQAYGKDGTHHTLKATIRLKMEYTSVDVYYEVANVDSYLTGQVYTVSLGTFTPDAQA